MRPNQQQTNSPTNKNESMKPPTPELVQEIADKVYSMWLRDLQIDQERRRVAANKRQRSYRGRYI